MAIRNGQDSGEIKRQGQGGGTPVPGVRGSVSRTLAPSGVDLPSPYEFASPHELSSTYGGIYDLTDGVTDDHFEEALTEARDEGNLSRANVVRKVHGLKSVRLTPAERLNMIGDMADAGHTSDQIAKAVGHGEDYVRRLAKENGIDVRADKIMRGTRRLDYSRAVQATVDSLAALAAGLDQIDVTRVDADQIENWAASMKESLAALNKLRNNLLKETTQ